MIVVPIADFTLAALAGSIGSFQNGTESIEIFFEADRGSPEFEARFPPPPPEDPGAPA